jgi:propanol-preferring alcohol dehydrogenase
MSAQEIPTPKNKNDGREAMKSFQVAEFNAPLKEVDQETPQPTGTQVLIKVKAAGVCHSDLHIWEGGYDLGHGRKPLSLKDRGVSLPRTMGTRRSARLSRSGPRSAPPTKEISR